MPTLKQYFIDWSRSAMGLEPHVRCPSCGDPPSSPRSTGPDLLRSRWAVTTIGVTPGPAGVTTAARFATTEARCLAKRPERGHLANAFGAVAMSFANGPAGPAACPGAGTARWRRSAR